VQDRAVSVGYPQFCRQSAACHYAEFRYAVCHFAESHYAEYRYSECRGAFMNTACELLYLSPYLLERCYTLTWKNLHDFFVIFIAFYFGYIFTPYLL